MKKFWNFTLLLMTALLALFLGLSALPPGLVPMSPLACAAGVLAGGLLAAAAWPALNRRRVSRWFLQRAPLAIPLLLFCGGTATLPAQSIRLRAWTNLPPTVTSLATSNLTGNAFTLQPNRGVGVMVKFTGNGATNLVINFEVSPDGSATNWTTMSPAFNAVFRGTNGASVVLAWTNLIAGNPAMLNNIFQIRPMQLTNYGASSINLSNIWWTYNSD